MHAPKGVQAGGKRQACPTRGRLGDANDDICYSKYHFVDILASIETHFILRTQLKAK